MAKQEFKAESKRLLDLMINSIYTHKDIFLREIISNASDALDKRYYLSLTDDSVAMPREDYGIRLTIDKENRTLTVSDNGIGMSAEDLEKNLGTIAASGTDRFRKELEGAASKGTKDSFADIIGKFGVGFYSAFMVADRVTVITRKCGEMQGWRWRSQGADGYEIAACAKKEYGTDVIMHIREDEFSRSSSDTNAAKSVAEDLLKKAGLTGDKKEPKDSETLADEKDVFSRYLREYPIYKLVKKYSDYIRYPIRMLMPQPKLKEGSTKENPEYEEEFVYEILNSMLPIWQKPKNEVTIQDYEKFYEEQYDDPVKPRLIIPLNVEGNITYKALIFVPGKAPEKYDTDEFAPGLTLYSSGVKVMEHCMGLLPEAFDYVRGIVDSPDLSLNISREILQQDKQLKVIAANIEKKLRAELEKLMQNDRASYEQFFKDFGRRIKVCAMDNYGEKKKELAGLLLFWSSKEGRLITLNDYVQNMPSEQKYIYYASGHTVEAIGRLPQTEVLKELGYDILYFTDKADELVADMFKSFNDKLFRSCIDGDLDLSEAEKEKLSGNSGGNEGSQETSVSDEEKQLIFKFIKEMLGERIDEVIESTKLRSHPVCLSSGKGISFEMEKYFRAMQPNLPVKAKRYLEVNTSHKAFFSLKNAIGDDPVRAGKYVEILYNQACMIAGLPVADPSGYTDLLISLWD